MKKTMALHERRQGPYALRNGSFHHALLMAPALMSMSSIGPVAVRFGQDHVGTLGERGRSARISHRAKPRSKTGRVNIGRCRHGKAAERKEITPWPFFPIPTQRQIRCLRHRQFLNRSPCVSRSRTGFRTKTRCPIRMKTTCRPSTPSQPPAIVILEHLAGAIASREPDNAGQQARLSGARYALRFIFPQHLRGLTPKRWRNLRLRLDHGLVNGRRDARRAAALGASCSCGVVLGQDVSSGGDPILYAVPAQLSGTTTCIVCLLFVLYYMWHESAGKTFMSAFPTARLFDECRPQSRGTFVHRNPDWSANSSTGEHAKIVETFAIAHGWRNSHIYPMTSVRTSIGHHMRSAGITGLTASRPKRMSSIRKKLVALAPSWTMPSRESRMKEIRDLNKPENWHSIF